ncbi:MAG: hypothetical protein MJ016_04850 [Victivallaceae bacterium]|nr:hypothetical protein [Victivallaceae bacterium]
MENDTSRPPVPSGENKSNNFSRVTAARIELLRRFINRSAHDAKAETVDKIYASVKPFLVGAESEADNEPPPRMGPAYRRHNELVAMCCNQKILLDEFAMLGDARRARLLKNLAELSGNAAPTNFTSLSAEENRLMGYFTALDAETAEAQLLEITKNATEEVKNMRKELL